ncbi:alpha/beta fold hydrolase [Symbioplanes lichenis]|uniref:alpha/beta fold hydrolase n=1 Tax=Symbioplanes lichenis TaxID=1629072 RepID=UPI0027388261|nr:alpha/beta hydrolase [Actinoplanes lichenis]
MPTIDVSGVTLSYEASGRGEPVLLLTGTGARGRSWALHQVPALTSGGLRAYTMDNRGSGDSGPAVPGLTVADLVADTVAVVERAVGGPCAFVGTSMGALVVQELLLVRPDLATRAVLMASRARPDPMSTALNNAERELGESGVALPPRYAAVVRALQNLSPATLADPELSQDWLDLFEFSPEDGASPGALAQLGVQLTTDRRGAYARVRTPVHVISFADDLIAPPRHGRELAAAIPGATYAEIPDAGHYGYLEQPDAVNAELLRFLGRRA